MAARELTSKSFITMPDGTYRPLSELSSEEKTEWQERTMKRLGEEMSIYYSSHPEQYDRLCEITEKYEKESECG